MIGERIRQARRMRGMSLRSLAENAGNITAQAISRYELGEDMPSSSVLIRLANALHVGTDYFFRTASVQLGEPAFRVHCDLLDRQKQEIESKVVDELERYVEVEQILDIDVRPQIYEPEAIKEPLTRLEDAENNAVELRKHWNMGIDPVGDITEMLEEHSVRVVFVDADQSFSGCAYRGMPPVIVVNRNHPSDRIRFTLVHELGHLVLNFPNDWDDKLREKAADRFAGAFLIPAEVARMELGNKRSQLSLFELMSLRQKYGISVQALIYRASDLGIITKTIEGRLWRTLAKAGLKKLELGKPLEGEMADRHKRLVIRAYTDGVISEAKAANLLDISIEKFCELLESTPE